MTLDAASLHPPTYVAEEEVKKSANRQLQDDVLEELGWELVLDASKISVAVTI